MVYLLMPWGLSLFSELAVSCNCYCPSYSCCSGAVCSCSQSGFWSRNSSAMQTCDCGYQALPDPSGTHIGAGGVLLSCSICPPGFSGPYSCAGGICVPCPSGRLMRPADYPGYNYPGYCYTCDAPGQVLPPGATSFSQCTNCPAGTYASYGDTTCRACPDGTYSAAGATSCATCKTGTVFRVDPAAPPQTFMAAHSAAAFCDPCPASTYWSFTDGRCMRCAYGSFSGPGWYQCGTCSYRSPYSNNPWGGIVLSLTSGQSSYYMGVDLTGVRAAATCTACPAGTYLLNAMTCAPCAAGFVSAAGYFYCVTCTGGSFLSVGASDSHNYATGDGHPARCAVCSDPKMMSIDGMSCVPRPCSPGYFANVTNPLAVVCSACPANTFSALGTACIVCGEDKFARSGATSCTACTAGQFISRTSLACVSCPAGTFAQGPGMTASDCVTCPAGTASAAGASACAVCAAGSWDIGNRTCGLCPANTYSGAAATTCIACPAQWTSPRGSASCTQCAAGSAWLSGACVPCAAGTYAARGANCSICPPGGWSAAGSAACLGCPPSQFLRFVNTGDGTPPATIVVGANGSSACTGCRGGRYSPGGMLITCPLCPPNSYSAPSAASCTCFSGFGRSATGACAQCPAGTVSDLNGTSNCVCPSAFNALRATGTVDGGSVCWPCARGPTLLAADANGTVTCLRCAAGSYAVRSVNSTTMGTCAKCPAGKYSGPGATSCQACPSRIPTSGYDWPYGYGSAFYDSVNRRNWDYYVMFRQLAPTPAADGCDMVASVVYYFDNSAALPVGAYAAAQCPDGFRGPIGQAAASARCYACPAGATSSADHSSCICPAGTSIDPASLSCVPCPPLQFSVAGGVCTYCPSGSVLTESTPPGTLSPGQALSGRFKLAACSACGQFAYALPGQASCVACSSGMIATSGGSAPCACSLGSYTPALVAPGSVLQICTPCAPGTFCGDIGCLSCSPCPSNYWSLPGASECLQCVPGQYLQVNGSGSTAALATGQVVSCISCAPGTASPSFGAPTAAACVTCAAGTAASAGQPACVACAPGTYAGVGAWNCTRCAPGTYSNGGAASCTPCAVSSYSTVVGASACSTCAAGLTTAGPGASVITSCYGCSPGWYSPAAGAPCSLCPTGSYSTAIGSSACTPCSDGTATLTAGAAAASACVACAPGSAVVSGAGACTPCASLYWSAGGARSCSACPSGRILVVTGSVTPSTPSSATVTASGSIVACRPCAPGTFAGPLATSCAPCPIGQISGLAASTCFVCSAGRWLTLAPLSVGLFRNGSGAAMQCEPCAPGSASSAAGATTSAVCNTCPAGTYANPWVPNSTVVLAPALCVRCPISTFTAGPGSPQCQACPSGFVSTADGSTGCYQCPAGTASGAGGACTPCSLGSFTDAPGYTSCMTCSAGTSTGVVGSRACVACLAGSSAAAGMPCGLCASGLYAPLAGAGACTPCSAGRFGTILGAVSASACAQCDTGTVSSPGATQCLRCYPGSYSGVFAIAPCTQCPSNTYSVSPGNVLVTSCLSCPSGQFSTPGASACGPQCAAGKATTQHPVHLDAAPSASFVYDDFEASAAWTARVNTGYWGTTVKQDCTTAYEGRCSLYMSASDARAFEQSNNLRQGMTSAGFAVASYPYIW
jgi:hypothetical protein